MEFVILAIGLVVGVAGAAMLIRAMRAQRAATGESLAVGKADTLLEASSNGAASTTVTPRLRMRADVRIGTALSGGLDSSATFCAMASRAGAISAAVSRCGRTR